MINKFDLLLDFRMFLSQLYISFYVILSKSVCLSSIGLLLNDQLQVISFWYFLCGAEIPVIIKESAGSIPVSIKESAGSNYVSQNTSSSKLAKKDLLSPGSPGNLESSGIQPSSKGEHNDYLKNFTQKQGWLYMVAQDMNSNYIYEDDAIFFLIFLWC